jgi:hypothetical protein
MHVAAPLLFGQHLSRKSVLDCDPIQKDAKRCKDLTALLE